MSGGSAGSGFSRRAFIGTGAVLASGAAALLRAPGLDGAGRLPSVLAASSEAPSAPPPDPLTAWVDVREFGAQGTSFPPVTGSIAAGSNRLALSGPCGLRSNQFNRAHFRPGIEVAGAGTSGAGSLVTTVTAVDSTGTVLTLAQPAAASVSGAPVAWDDASPIQAALDFAIDPTGTHPPGSGGRVPTGPVYVPAGAYRLTRGLLAATHALPTGPASSSRRASRGSPRRSRRMPIGRARSQHLSESCDRIGISARNGVGRVTLTGLVRSPDGEVGQQALQRLWPVRDGIVDEALGEVVARTPVQRDPFGRPRRQRADASEIVSPWRRAAVDVGQAPQLGVVRGVGDVRRR